MGTSWLTVHRVPLFSRAGGRAGGRALPLSPAPQCCPRNYTEAWFEGDHSRYSAHPAVLLAHVNASTSTVMQ